MIRWKEKADEYQWKLRVDILENIKAFEKDEKIWWNDGQFLWVNKAEMLDILEFGEELYGDYFDI